MAIESGQAGADCEARIKARDEEKRRLRMTRKRSGGMDYIADISAAVSENLLIPQYFYKTEYPKIGLASTLYVPVRYQSAVRGVYLLIRSMQRIST